MALSGCSKPNWSGEPGAGVGGNCRPLEYALYGCILINISEIILSYLVRGGALIRGSQSASVSGKVK